MRMMFFPTLSTREARACEAYYRLGQTDAQIAKAFGVTRPAITHRRRSAIRKLAGHPSAAVRRLAKSLASRPTKRRCLSMPD